MSYTHLSRDDRIRLDVLLRSGLSIKACAKGMGFSRQTINDEVNNNGGKKRYNPYQANKSANQRRHDANQCHRKWSDDNWHMRITIRLLKSGWSPEQVIGRIKIELKIKPFCMATIYNNVNPDKEINRLLPRKHNKYRRRKDGNERKRQREELDTKKLIDARPKIVNGRVRIGDWETDTIVGKEKTARILTDVDRKSGYLLADLLHEVTAKLINESQIKLLSNVPEGKRHTLTSDNGLEFADWELTEKEAKIDILCACLSFMGERHKREH